MKGPDEQTAVQVVVCPFVVGAKTEAEKERLLPLSAAAHYEGPTILVDVRCSSAVAAFGPCPHRAGHA